MAKEKDLAVFAALYDDVETARSDLEAIDRLHKDELVGTFDAAVVTNEDGKPKVVARLDRPMVRVIPERLGFGPLSRKELKELAGELTAHEAALMVVGEPTLERAFDKAVTHAAKAVKQVVDATSDELSQELQPTGATVGPPVHRAASEENLDLGNGSQRPVSSAGPDARTS